MYISYYDNIYSPTSCINCVCKQRYMKLSLIFCTKRFQCSIPFKLWVQQCLKLSALQVLLGLCTFKDCPYKSTVLETRTNFLNWMILELLCSTLLSLIQTPHSYNYVHCKYGFQPHCGLHAELQELSTKKEIPENVRYTASTAERFFLEIRSGIIPRNVRYIPCTKTSVPLKCYRQLG